MRNPFIPSRSPVCRAADQVLMFSVALAGCAAVIAVFVKQIWVWL